MPVRSVRFSPNEHYHCYNRGVEKRIIFLDPQDFSYFIKSLNAFNSTEALGKQRLHEIRASKTPLVNILASCLLPNHYHLLLEELEEGGISKFMSRVGISYSKYFNEKYKRSGSLFQGRFQAKHVNSDQDLQQLISYVYYNNHVHSITDASKYRSYINQTNSFVRLRESNFRREVVEIIKEKRLDFKE